MNNLIFIIVMMIIGSIIGAFGAIYLKIGSKLFRIKLTYKGMIEFIENWKLILGVVLYGISTIFFIIAIKFGELSIVNPLTSLGYIFITILSAWILKEKINAYKIAGICLIVLGVVLVTV